MNAAAYPATLIVHTPKGQEPCCDKHAAQLRGAMFLLAAHVFTVPAEAGAECNNCRNEMAREVIA